MNSTALSELYGLGRAFMLFGTFRGTKMKTAELEVKLKQVNPHRYVTDKQIADLLGLSCEAVRAWFEDSHSIPQVHFNKHDEAYKMSGAELLCSYEQIMRQVHLLYRPRFLRIRARRLAHENDARIAREKWEHDARMAVLELSRQQALYAHAQQVIHRICTEMDAGLYNGVDALDFLDDTPSNEQLCQTESDPVEPVKDVEKLCEPELQAMGGGKPRFVSSRRWKRRKAA